MGQILTSLSPAYGGYSIARDEKVVLIKGALPGEVVEVEIEEKKRDYSTARVISVVEPSEDRVDPPCPVFGICGGCQLQFASYPRQVAMKDEILLDSLSRIGGLEIALGPALTDKQWNYRRRAQLKVAKTGEIGFFKAASRDVVVFDSCPLMDDRINALIAGLKGKLEQSGLKEVHIAYGDSPIARLIGRSHGKTLHEQFMEAGFAGVGYDGGLVAGADSTSLDLNGLTYTVSAWTFFQAHWELNRKLVRFMVSELGPLEGKRVLDLYAGAGNFALPLAGQAGDVVAVEENTHAADDAEHNIGVNNLKNMKVVRTTAEKYKIQKKFNIIILDPPRPGLTSEVAKKVLDSQAESVVYVSCNPATLARDLKKLKDKYEILSARQIDFFPNTFHIESISFLRLR